MKNKLFITTIELSERWQLSPATLERWRSESIGPVFMKVGGAVRYRVDDIIDYEEGCLRRSTSISVHRGEL